MKSWTRTIIYITAIVLVVALISSAVTVMVMNRAKKDTVVMTTEEYNQLSALMALKDIMKKIQSDYYEAPPSEAQMLEGAANGIVDTLDDPYARYYTNEEYEDYISTVNGEYQGLGILIGQPDDVGSKVLDAYEGNPAAEAGVLTGDIITHVNGELVANMMLEDLRALVNVSPGETVVLTVLRAGESMDFSVVSGTVNIKRVESYLYNERTGYIRISMFTGTCAEEFNEAIKDLKSRNMRSLVIDLRDNPGGSLDTVVSVAENLLGKGQLIVSVGSADSKDETVYKAVGKAIDVPLAIIVNENSASASEILAAAVQDNGVGKIIGTTTYGKGIVQTTSMLDNNGGWLKITTDAYYTPSGKNIHGVGVTPNIQVALADDLQGKAVTEIAQEEDAQLWAALDYVRAAANGTWEE